LEKKEIERRIKEIRWFVSFFFFIIQGNLNLKKW
jgi:hypothetical protein